MTNSFYKIPNDFPTVIQFSGGRTSGFMLNKILDANQDLPNNFHVLFQNTGREMDQTLDFVRDCSINFSVNITWLEYICNPPFFKIVNYETASRNGEPFEALIKKRKYLPNVVTRYCSDVLKYRTAKRYLVNMGYKKWNSAIGFRADEMRRVERIHSRKHIREIIWTPLADAGITKSDIQIFWDNQSFNLGLIGIKGKTPLGNCDGCFLKSEKNLANLCREYPERALWWRNMEAMFGKTFVKDRRWSDLIDTVEKQHEFAFSDQADVFCNSVHGSCEGY